MSSRAESLLNEIKERVGEINKQSGRDQPENQISNDSVNKEVLPPSMEELSTGGPDLGVLGKTGRGLARQVGGFLQGAGEASNPISIPRGLVNIALLATPGVSKETRERLVDKVPSMSIAEQAASLEATARKIGGNKEDWLNLYERIKKEKNDYVNSLPETAQTVGTVAALAPSMYQLGKGTINIAARVGSKSPNIIRGLAGALKKSTIKKGLGEKVGETVSEFPGKVLGMSSKGSRTFYGFTTDLSNEMGQYLKNIRNNYRTEMDPLIKSRGNVPVETKQVVGVMKEVMADSDLYPQSFVKYVAGEIKNLRGKKTITFKQANELKQTMSSKFSAFKPGPEPVALDPRVTAGAAASRKVAGTLKDVINKTVVDSNGESLTASINAKFHYGMDLLDDMSGIIGKESNVGHLLTSETGVASTMSPTSGTGKLNILEDFANAWSPAKGPVDNIRSYLASQSINSVDPRVTVVAGGGGLTGVVSNPLQFLGHEYYKGKIGLLSRLKDQKMLQPILPSSPPGAIPMPSGVEKATRFAPIASQWGRRD
jgi:hypothetical protein